MSAAGHRRSDFALLRRCPLVFPIRLALLLISAGMFAQPDLFDKALAEYQGKQYSQALESIEGALRQDANKPAYIHLYGAVLGALGRLDAAEESLRRAADLAPGEAAYAYDLGALLHQEKRYASAVPVLRRAVELAPENLDARMMLARSYVFSYHELKLPDFVDLTLAQLNYIVSRNPAFPAVHHHLALVYINSGEPAKAVEELNTELRYYPNNAQARLELGETLLKLNQNRKAISELQQAARQSPEMTPIYYALGKAYKADGQAERAIDSLRHCVELDRAFASCHFLLGGLYRDADHSEEARKEFEVFEQLRQQPAAANR